jgi:hypothetical protein
VSRDEELLGRKTVGFLDSFERQVERVVGGAFAKTFTSGVHPIEIVAALKRELDSSARVTSRTRVLAPHSFRVGLAEVDLIRLNSLGEGFLDEITQAIFDYAKARGYSFSASPQIVLRHQPRLIEGLVEARSDKLPPVVWVPVLSHNGVRFPVTRASTTIGRGSEADVQITSRGVSRIHAEIRWNGKRAEVVDRGSTNGTKLDGEVVSRAALPDVCTLELGQARILFEVVPQAKAAYDALVRNSLATSQETP